jgi:hypothetical protein
MAIDIREIQLSDEQKRCIVEIAERTGQPWSEVLREELAGLADRNASEHFWTYKDRYIRDPQKRRAFFREWIAQQTSHNPHFDDSRESIYFDRS